MTITFPATPRTNLVIHDHPSEQYEPVDSIEELVWDRWIPYVAADQESQLLPDIICVAGSSIGSSLTGASDGNKTTTSSTTRSTTTAISSTEELIAHYDTLPTYTGLIGTILTAYNLHQNLELRPDDVCITILGQFALYVNGRPEELWSALVAHAGQVELTVVTQ